MTIVTQINGGLGNQMFQYAAGFALSKSKNVEHELDTSIFNYYPLHQGFELFKVFNCTSSLVSQKNRKKHISWYYEVCQRYLPNKKITQLLMSNTIIVEPQFHYWEGIKDVPDGSYLSGYWQSEKYFQFIEREIRKEFLFKLALEHKNLCLLKKIKTNNSICLHIRRGDYVSNQKTNNLHGTCSINYYKEAIKYFYSKFKSPVFFIFSDDQDWAINNLKLPTEHVFIDHNLNTKSHFDMQLMSHCKHHIIANSSFSWWGAWLCENPQQTVIAPKNWFANSDKNTSDLLPSHWIRM